jgi:tetratricopeptide (TPR) repeat protein
LGDYIKAEQLLEQARDIFLNIGDRRNASYSAGNLANILVYFGRYREARRLFEAADRVFLSLGEDHPHYYTVGNIGDIQLLLGEIEAARRKYEQVIDFALRNGDKELEAETIIRFGECDFYSGDPSKAKELYRRGIELALSIESLEFRTRGVVGLCRLLVGDQDFSELDSQLQILRELAVATDSERTRFEAEFLSGERARLMGKAAQAVKCYDRCIEYGKRQRQFELLIKCYVRIHELIPGRRDKAKKQLSALLNTFLENNGESHLRQLLTSDYWRFFVDTLQQIRLGTAVSFVR